MIVSGIENFDTNTRDFKGKSLLEEVSDYIALDLETTGLDPNFDEIIEIAAIKVTNNDEVESFHTLVKPDYEIDEFITELTGITNEMLKDAPKLSEVIEDFISFIGTGNVIAHNANFDVNFIYDACVQNKLPPFKNDFIDTMRVSRRMFPEHKQHRLFDLTERFNFGNELEHRALSDARAVIFCYEFMKNHARENSILFSDLYPKNYAARAKNITTANTEFDEESSIFGNEFVFTGVLQKMVRKDAMQYVVDAGGTCGDSVTKKTNYLVLGNNDYCSTIKGGKSNKQKKAEKLKLSGSDIEVISEDVFYEFIFN